MLLRSNTSKFICWQLVVSVGVVTDR